MSDDERRQDTPAPLGPTPGSGASPPVPPEFLWGLWSCITGVPEWVTNSVDSPALLVFVEREHAERERVWTKGMVTPALIGVSPAVVAQRDRLGGALAEAEAEIQRELDWLLTIRATDGLKYRRLKEYQRRWGILLIEWREAQGREHEGSTADGQ
jgi:hypothetical protein